MLYKHGAGVEWLYGADVTPGSFEFFSMPALYGRAMQAEDYKAGAPPVFVLGYKAWKTHFDWTHATALGAQAKCRSGFALAFQYGSRCAN